MTCILGWLLLLLGSTTASGQGTPVGNSMDFVVPMPPTGYGNTLIVYICTGTREANITTTVYIDAVATTKTYHIAANSALQLPATSVSMMMPLMPGTVDTVYRRCEKIHSDVPVSAYAHYAESSASGATQLIPVRSWGYAYTTMDVPFDPGSYVCVTAAFNNTKVQIVSTRLTNSGHAIGDPYTITLNKGEVFQVRKPVGGSDPLGELTGTTVTSVPNSFGISYPVGIYSGSYGMGLLSAPGLSGSGDFEVGQQTPTCQWGQHFLTAPFSSGTSTDDQDVIDYAIYRVMVKDPATVVKKNGVVLTGLIDNLYYQYIDNTADYIEADGPIMMTQNMFSMDEPTYKPAGSCDGEMIMLNPLETAAKRSDFFLPSKYNLGADFISLMIPTTGLASLTINGSNVFTYTYTHPNKPDYTVVVKRMPANDIYCTVQSNVAFNGIYYGVPTKTKEAESSGYDLTHVYYPEGDAMLTRKYDNSLMKNFACVEDSFQLVLKTEYLPQRLEWFLKDYPGLVPNDANVVLNNPVPDSTVTVDGHTYHYFVLKPYYKFTISGDYAIPVIVTSPLINNCSQMQTFVAELTGGKLPVADFSFTHPACLPFPTQFKAGADGDTSTLVAWKWSFTGLDTIYTSTASYTYAAEGKDSVYLRVTGSNGCSSDTVKSFELKEAPKPVAAFKLPALLCLPGDSAVFINQSTYAGTAGPVGYQWQLGDGATAVVTDPVHYYPKAGNYDVTLVATATDGCSDTVVQVLSSFVSRPKAGFVIAATSSFCMGGDVTLTDSSTFPVGSGIAVWSWVLGDGSTDSTKDVVKQYDQPGTYTIQHFVQGKEGCLSDTVSKTIELYDVPKVDAGPDKVMLEGASVRLESSATITGDVVFRWTPAAYTSAPDSVGTFAMPPSTQLYYLTASNARCSAYDSVLVTVLKNLVIPNVFSPNGDGVHDLWEIAGLNTYPSSVVQVFNRYGQKVFESHGYPTPWDGRTNGNLLPVGTYYYIIHPGQGKDVQSGSVTILR